MCGICGFIGEVDDSKKVLKQMMDKIAHRGPDDEGMYVDKHAAIGHRRLSIIDLSHGAQPMYNETGDVAIVFNGEIYNHLEIRKELIAKGHKFANDSDTECLIHGYEEYGTDLLSKLRGMFAFCNIGIQELIQCLVQETILELSLFITHYLIRI